MCPEFIVGDLDSLRQDVRDYYESVGTRVIYDPDQVYRNLVINFVERTIRYATEREERDEEQEEKANIIAEYQRLRQMCAVRSQGLC
jgi:hypothetical protein